MLTSSKVVKHFNPRSREGSDRWNDFCKVTSVNFNPRSREGSDNITGQDFADFMNFNPRSREGSDANRQNLYSHFRISIHAPARGATKNNTYATVHRKYFNPRSREGSDLTTIYVCYCRHDYFNPRSREGSDKMQLQKSTQINRFQSTLPRGERQNRRFRKGV